MLAEGQAQHKQKHLSIFTIIVSTMRTLIEHKDNNGSLPQQQKFIKAEGQAK